MKAKTKVSKSKARSAENCDLCARVPGITPDQIADPRFDVCKPGEFEKLLDGGATLVEIRQDGCGACKLADEQILPKIEGRKIQITVGGLAACDRLADKLKVQATPTFIVFKDGKEAWRSEGVTKPEKDIEELRRRLA